LLVLDNLESLLEPGQAGIYRPGYEPYGQLIHQMATLEHRSHLMLTSRERPRGYRRLERDGHPVKTLPLAGLDNEAGSQLLLQRGVHGDDDQEATLISRYSGSPLALKLVADTVDEIFGGDLAEFLTDDTLIFDDIRTVLDQHFLRLTDLEQQVLFWLAIERETTSLATLRSNLLDPPSQRVLLETLRNLQLRSLIEHQAGGFALQNVVMEYLTDRLVGEVYAEIRTGTLYHLHHYALVKTESKEYVRQSQIRVLLEPVLQRLETDLTRAGLYDRLLELIQRLRNDFGRRPSYAAGTILNAMIHLGLTLDGVDLSGICLWQTDLRNRTAGRLNLTGADLSRSLFNQTFGRVEAVAVSPDGDKFAIGGDGGYVRIYDIESRQYLLTLSGHTNTVAGVAFGAHGNLLASAGHDGTVRLWNLERQEQTHLWETNGAMLAVDFSRDGALLIGVGHAGLVYLWDVARGVLHAALDGHTDIIRALALHPDGNRFATGSGDGEIRLWELVRDRPDEICGPAAGAASISLRHDVDSVISLAFSPDGSLLASGNKAGGVSLWDAKSLEPLAAFQAHTMETRALTFGPEGRYLYTGGGGGASSIRIWDVVRNELLAKLFQDETTWSLGLTPDGKTLVSGREDGTVHLWNVAEPSNTALIQTVYGYRMSLNALAWSPCGRWLATGDVHGDIFVWDVSGGQPGQRHRLRCEDGPVVSVAFSPDGNLLASASGAATQHSVRIWDTVSGARQATAFAGMEQSTVAFVHGGERVVGSGRDGAVSFWEIDNPELQPARYGIHAEPGQFYIACDRTGMMMVTNGEGRTVDVWDIAACADEPPALLHTLTGYRANRGAAFDSEANLLACAGPAYSIAVWRLTAPGREVLLHTLEGHTNQISSIAFSPGGSRLVSCSFDRSVRLWDVETGRQLALLGKHAQFALGVAFSPDGSRVASIGKEGFLLIWNSHTGKQEHVLRAPVPYAGMNITGVTGISEAQRAALKALGAVETTPPFAEIAPASL
jgi:WD40 repeat protein